MKSQECQSIFLKVEKDQHYVCKRLAKIKIWVKFNTKIKSNFKKESRLSKESW